MVLGGWGGVWRGEEGRPVTMDRSMGPYNPFKGLRVFGGSIFYIFFSGFAIDRSKKYVKVIKNHIKLDALDPQAAADNHPPQSQWLGLCDTTIPKNPTNSAGVLEC